MVTDPQNDPGTNLLGSIRESFEQRDWNGTLETFEAMRETFKGQRSVRVEATCLAARALAAQKQRARARQLLGPIAAADYPKPLHYDYLARAFLDLKDFKEAARLCQRAAALVAVQGAPAAKKKDDKPAAVRKPPPAPKAAAAPSVPAAPAPARPAPQEAAQPWWRGLGRRPKPGDQPKRG